MELVKAGFLRENGVTISQECIKVDRSWLGGASPELWKSLEALIAP
ncbi:hypothetical protein [Pendulispora albinea]|uniref:Uncharacterized protein n=1 Tax=Pendulispora albinea TaxID=2741071 RepID=A0ABZ2M765_9BACT